MVATAHERSRFDHLEPTLQTLDFDLGELIRSHPPIKGQVIARGLKILPDGEDVRVRLCANVIHQVEDFRIALANTAPWVKTRGTLDASGKAQASIVFPKVPSALGVVLYHAYLVYDPKGNFYLASNPTTLLGVK